VRTELPLSSAELAAKYDVPERLVLHWARTGRIATYQQPSGRRMYLPSEVRRLLSGPRQ
jgi:hypothetical protein